MRPEELPQQLEGLPPGHVRAEAAAAPQLSMQPVPGLARAEAALVPPKALPVRAQGHPRPEGGRQPVPQLGGGPTALHAPQRLRPALAPTVHWAAPEPLLSRRSEALIGWKGEAT